MNDALRHVWTIAKRELAGYFNSPVAYVFIVIFLLLNGFFTFMLGYFFERGQASLAEPFFSWHPWLYLFLVPAVGMRLWAEERRGGTLELLLTMPISPWQAIVGKFLASWLFLGLALLLTFPVVLTVSFLGNPDNGTIWSGYLGSFLLAGAYLGVTELMSAMTRNQIIAFIISVVVCFFLILCGWEPVTNLLVNWAPESVVSLVKSFSTWYHYAAFQRGVVDLRDLAYFASVIGFSLFATGVVLRGVRGA
jgi:ABC-2 type transport system permease protein